MDPNWKLRIFENCALIDQIGHQYELSAILGAEVHMGHFYGHFSSAGKFQNFMVAPKRLETASNRFSGSNIGYIPNFSFFR
jgi:hypothetical protein